MYHYMFDNNKASTKHHGIIVSGRFLQTELVHSGRPAFVPLISFDGMMGKTQGTADFLCQEGIKCAIFRRYLSLTHTKFIQSRKRLLFQQTRWRPLRYVPLEIQRSRMKKYQSRDMWISTKKDTDSDFKNRDSGIGENERGYHNHGDVIRQQLALYYGFSHFTPLT